MDSAQFLALIVDAGYAVVSLIGVAVVAVVGLLVVMWGIRAGIDATRVTASERELFGPGGVSGQVMEDYNRAVLASEWSEVDDDSLRTGAYGEDGFTDDELRSMRGY